MTADEKERFLEDVTIECEVYGRRFRRWGLMEATVLILIAVAGAITAFAGGTGANHTSVPPWWATSTTLLVCGVIAAAGAAINQGIKPGEKKCCASKSADALRNLADAVEWRDLPLDEASRVRSLARSDPQEANRRLLNGKGRSTT